MKLCIKCKKAEKQGSYYACTTPEIQEWEKNLRTSFVTGKITPIYCDAARSSEKMCGTIGKFYEEHTQETLELREITSGHTSIVQSVGGEKGVIRSHLDEKKS